MYLKRFLNWNGRRSLSSSLTTYLDTLSGTVAEDLTTEKVVTVPRFFPSPRQCPMRLQRDHFAMTRAETWYVRSPILTERLIPSSCVHKPDTRVRLSLTSRDSPKWTACSQASRDLERYTCVVLCESKIVNLGRYCLPDPVYDSMLFIWNSRRLIWKLTANYAFKATPLPQTKDDSGVKGKTGWLRPW